MKRKKKLSPMILDILRDSLKIERAKKKLRKLTEDGVTEIMEQIQNLK